VFDRILVALDGSEEARSAGTLGLRVAEHMRSRVTGISVIDVRVVEGPAVGVLPYARTLALILRCPSSTREMTR